MPPWAVCFFAGLVPAAGSVVLGAPAAGTQVLGQARRGPAVVRKELPAASVEARQNLAAEPAAAWAVTPSGKDRPDRWPPPELRAHSAGSGSGGAAAGNVSNTTRVSSTATGHSATVVDKAVPGTWECAKDVTVHDCLHKGGGGYEYATDSDFANVVEAAVDVWDKLSALLSRMLGLEKAPPSMCGCPCCRRGLALSWRPPPVKSKRKAKAAEASGSTVLFAAAVGSAAIAGIGTGAGFFVFFGGSGAAAGCQGTAAAVEGSGASPQQ